MLCFNFLALVCPLFKRAFGLVPACPSSPRLRRGAEAPPAAHSSRSRTPAKPDTLEGSGVGACVRADITNDRRKLGEKWRRNYHNGREENRTKEMLGWKEGKEGRRPRL